MEWKQVHTTTAHQLVTPSKMYLLY